jgi:type VII secretion integral membrane protein EccD
VTARVSTGGGTVNDSLCRLTVQSGEDDGSFAVDLALPSDADVGLLMPSIVDLVHHDTTNDARRWRLSRIGGSLLDESTTLRDNDVRDGELLLLTAVAPPVPRWVGRDPCHVVANADDGSHPRALRVIAIVACLCVAGIGAAALMWSGVTLRAAGHLITGGLLAAVVAVGAVVARRSLHDELPCVALSVIAVVYAAVTGFIAVPAAPSAANGLLAAAAGLSMAALLLRLTGCGTVCLIAVTSSSALAAATAAVGVVWTLPTEAMGAALAILSLGALGLAARLSIMIAGLSSADVDDAQAILANQTLTGLVIGSSGAAPLGTVLVACGRLDDGGSRLSAAVFTAVVGLVLLLRARTHSGLARRIALASGGLVSITVGLAVTVVSAPAHAHWMTVLAVVAGAGSLGSSLGLTLSPVLRRAIEVLEYLALAAVMPLACWVVGLYGLVRGSSLT